MTERAAGDVATATDLEITYSSTMSVDLVWNMASDAQVVASARVSTAGQNSKLTATTLLADSPEDKLIRYLMRSRHGSPFEHSMMTFLIEAPIFVWREFMRHRIASYNEESGRYRQLRPKFYIPGPDRSLQQIGKPGHYTFIAGTGAQTAAVESAAKQTARLAYLAYQRQLEVGVAKEVARMVLPLSIYSSAYVTMNARALMNFLSLRIHHEDAAYPSYPQREIEMVAEQMEGWWAKLMPLTHQAFNAAGRLAP